jgi:hypothetical protein
MEAGNSRLTGDTKRQATSSEIHYIKVENKATSATLPISLFHRRAKHNNKLPRHKMHQTVIAKPAFDAHIFSFAEEMNIALDIICQCLGIPHR